MRRFFREIFEDDKGQYSNMRTMSMAALFYSFFFASYALVKDREINVEVLVIFVVAAFAPKVVQKFAESKVGNGHPKEQL